LLIRKFGLFSAFVFLPKGVNIFIAGLLIGIEIISNIVKFVSLAVRLFANMFSGHMLLKTVYSVVHAVLKKINPLSYSLFVLSGLIGLAISFLEAFIAILQAGVFTMLGALFYLDAAEANKGH
jgi:F-type H+-transporting ATPase subunit a